MFTPYYGHLRSCALNLFKKRCSLRFVSHKGSYEGEGKTTMTILNKDLNYGLMVNSISTVGFTLNIGITMIGPVILFPKTIFGWHLSSSDDIHEDSLTLFKVLEPKPDLLILGLDQSYPREEPFIMNFRKIVKKMGMNTEILPVDQACHIFNFLNAENRYIVGLFLPPKEIRNIDHILIKDRSVQQVLAEPYRGAFFKTKDDNKFLK